MLSLNRIFLGLFIFLLATCTKNGGQKGSETIIPEITAPPAGESQPLSFNDFLDTAHLAYQNRAFQNLDQLLKENRDRFSGESQKKEIHLLDAMLLLSQKKWEESQKILESLSEDKDASLKGRAIFYLGEIERFRGKPEQAIPLYMKAHKFFPSDEIYSSLGDVHAQMGHWKEAIQYYKTLVSHNPQDPRDLFLLGAAYYQSQQPIQSEKTMKKVLKLDPRNKYAYQYLAHIAKDRGDLRNYYYNLSRGILLMREYDSVIQLLNNQSLVYKDADLASILISSLARKQENDKALQVYKRAIKENPALSKTSDFQVYYGILDVLPHQGEVAGREYFRRLAKIYPNNFLVVSTYASVLENYHVNTQELESAYLQALYLDPSDTIMRYRLAEYYQNQKKIEMAQLEYGILYFYQNQKEEALESLLNLEGKAPTFRNVQLFLYIGLLYQQKGEKELAKRYYQKVLKIDEKNPEAQMALIQLKH